MMAGVKRRTFLSLPLGIAGGMALRLTRADDGKGDRLRGFIVSDAHVGSTNVSQPTPDTQQAVMRHILERFPNLDICIDTGDAHHAEVPGKHGKAKARADWLSRIAGQSYCPFFYVPGNHELSSAHADPELVTCDMGSLALRPYHSFTIKGIHFISLPQLIKTILVSKETIDWLRLDLEVHRDKTVIVLAHNSIAGTTFTDGVTAYRQIINSPEVLEVLAGHPNVIAWMHGHNHQYEIVEKDDRVYVSNGRIGGFNPPERWGPFGQGHLGGIYFEVAASRLLVRAYSATAGQFMDAIGMPHLSLEKPISTTFNGNEAASVCTGRGAARDGTQDVVHSHFLSSTPKATVHLAQTSGQPINDNWDLALETRLHRKRTKNKLIGLRIDEDDAWHGWEKGIEVLPRTDGKTVVLTVPQSAKLVDQPRRASYLNCNPGGRYELRLDVEAGAGGQSIDATFRLRTTDLKILGKWNIGSLTLKKGVATQKLAFEIPSRKVLNVSDDAALHLLVFITMGNLSPGLRFDNIRISPTAADTVSNRSGLRINEQRLSFTDKSGVQTFALNKLVGKQLKTQVSCHHTKQLAWLIKQDNLTWQVRNATVAGTADKLKLSARDKYVPKQEIVIAPFGIRARPYVSRLTNAKEVTIEGLASASELYIVVAEATDSSRPVVAEIASETLPENAQSLDINSFTKGIISINLKVGVPAELQYERLDQGKAT